MVLPQCVQDTAHGAATRTMCCSACYQFHKAARRWLAGKRLVQPIAFIAGADDSVMSFYGGQEKV
eukprot:COSAG06_NODE_31226_length_525_cov_0.652582_1_plen_64_part_01